MSFWRKNKKVTICLPQSLNGKSGIFAAPVNSIGLNGPFQGTVLCVQDERQNIEDLSKIVSIYLSVKSGIINTDYGTIMFLLFTFYDENNPWDKFTYEVLLNPSDMSSLTHYGILASQDQWKVFVVFNNAVLNTFEFENIYDLEDSLNTAIKLSGNNKCIDFKSAKQQYFREYNMDTLLKL